MDNIEQMVRETMMLRSFLEYEERPGVIYFVEKKQHTFLIRAKASANIKKDMETVTEEHLEVHYTPFVELAEIICDNVTQTRYPYNEDLFSYSDPGLYWWAEVGRHSIRVTFGAGGHFSTKSPIKLGPLGDSNIAFEYFKECHSWFKSLFMLDDYSCDEKGLHLSVTSSNENFNQMKDLFFNGVFSDNFLKGEKGRTYLSEIAATRKFWKSLENDFLQRNDEYSHI